MTSERQYVAIVRGGYGMLVMGAWHVAARRDDVPGGLDSVRVLP